MGSIKSIFVLCITLLIGIVTTLAYMNQRDRYTISINNGDVFIFDHKNANLMYCTKRKCQMIPLLGSSLEGMAIIKGIPSQMSFANPQQIMLPVPSQKVQKSTVPPIITSPVFSQSAATHSRNDENKNSNDEGKGINDEQDDPDTGGNESPRT